MYRKKLVIHGRPLLRTGKCPMTSVIHPVNSVRCILVTDGWVSARASAPVRPVLMEFELRDVNHKNIIPIEILD